MLEDNKKLNETIKKRLEIKRLCILSFDGAEANDAITEGFSLFYFRYKCAKY